MIDINWKTYLQIFFFGMHTFAQLSMSSIRDFKELFKPSRTLLTLACRALESQKAFRCIEEYIFFSVSSNRTSPWQKNVMLIIKGLNSYRLLFTKQECSLTIEYYLNGDIRKFTYKKFLPQQIFCFPIGTYELASTPIH